MTTSLIKNIHKKIESLAHSHPYQDLRYIVLSGGLGSSKYIKKRLVDEFSANTSRRANRVEILVAPEPQLAVVKGLVMDRAQSLDQDVTVWAGRCCRVSYGVVCKVRYDSKQHAGETISRDSTTGTLWVEGQIDWFIKEVSRSLTVSISSEESRLLTTLIGRNCT